MIRGKWVSSKQKLPKQDVWVLTFSDHAGYKMMAHSNRWKNDWSVLSKDDNNLMSKWRGWYDDHDWKVIDEQVIWWDGELPVCDRHEGGAE